MKRTLIVAACSTLFIGAAHAEYSIYGLLDGSVGKSIADDQAATKKQADFHSGGDNGGGVEGNSTSRVGLKGSTDVGSGVKANFKLETGGIGSDGAVTGGGHFFDRQAWFGFSGAFGEVRFGRQDSVPFQTFIDFDYNGASNGVSAAGYSGAGRWLQDRQSKSLQYISPTFAGVKGQLGYVRKDGTVVGAKDVVSGGLTYTAGGLSVAGGFQTKASDAVGAGSTPAGNNYFGVAAGYDLGMVKFTAGYHDQKVIKGVNAGVQVTVSGFAIGAIYGVETKDDVRNAKGSAVELYVNKEILKGTYAYAEVGIADKKVAGGKGTGAAVGVIYTF